eukprot:1506462-Prymnesium_polylepis.1
MPERMNSSARAARLGKVRAHHQAFAQQPELLVAVAPVCRLRTRLEAGAMVRKVHRRVAEEHNQHPTLAAADPSTRVPQR